MRIWKNRYNSDHIYKDRVRIDEKGYRYSEHWRKLSGIPITEQWLKDFGFVKNTYGWYRNEAGGLLEVLFHDTGMNLCVLSLCLEHIKYVHQLQNLYFHLTQNELKIQNDK